MHKNKKIYFFIFFIILLSLSIVLLQNLYSKKSKNICIVYSDSLKKDSELVYLDTNFNKKNSIQIAARDVISSSSEKGTILLPTASDNKLFKIDKNQVATSSKVNLGGSYIKNKNYEQLILYNVCLEYNKINFITSDSQEKSLDIKDSLLLSGDFDNKNIYVLGYKFDKNKEGDTFLFIIDKSEFKIKDEIKLTDNMRIYDTALIDDKLFIGVDTKVDFLLYYDITTCTFNEIKHKNHIQNGTMDTKNILYTDKYIFYLSLDGNILKLNRETLNIEKNIKLDNKTILNGCIYKNQLYTLSVDIDKNNQISLVDSFDCDSLNNTNNFSIDPIRNTTPRSILALDNN